MPGFLDPGAADAAVVQRTCQQHAADTKRRQVPEVVRGAHPAGGEDALIGRQFHHPLQPVEIGSPVAADPRQGHGDDAPGPDFGPLHKAGGPEEAGVPEIERQDEPAAVGAAEKPLQGLRAGSSG